MKSGENPYSLANLDDIRKEIELPDNSVAYAELYGMDILKADKTKHSGNRVDFLEDRGVRPSASFFLKGNNFHIYSSKQSFNTIALIAMVNNLDPKKDYVETIFKASEYLNMPLYNNKGEYFSSYSDYKGKKPTTKTDAQKNLENYQNTVTKPRKQEIKAQEKPSQIITKISELNEKDHKQIFDEMEKRGFAPEIITKIKTADGKPIINAIDYKYLQNNEYHDAKSAYGVEALTHQDDIKLSTVAHGIRFNYETQENDLTNIIDLKKDGTTIVNILKINLKLDEKKHIPIGYKESKGAYKVSKTADATFSPFKKDGEFFIKVDVKQDDKITYSNTHPFKKGDEKIAINIPTKGEVTLEKKGEKLNDDSGKWIKSPTSRVPVKTPSTTLSFYQGVNSSKQYVFEGASDLKAAVILAKRGDEHFKDFLSNDTLNYNVIVLNSINNIRYLEYALQQTTSSKLLTHNITEDKTRKINIMNIAPIKPDERKQKITDKMINSGFKTPDEIILALDNDIVKKFDKQKEMSQINKREHAKRLKNTIDAYLSNDPEQIIIAKKTTQDIEDYIDIGAGEKTTIEIEQAIKSINKEAENINIKFTNLAKKYYPNNDLRDYMNASKPTEEDGEKYTPTRTIQKHIINNPN
jgi:hypothetical protein